MLIRVEIPVDAQGIDRLLRQVFNGDGEADLVQQLREDGLITLGMVATDDEGQVIGYIAYSPVSLNDEDRLWVGLAPLAVAPEWQKQGVGKSLVYESLDSLNEFSYAAVVVLGEPEYYQRFGFTPASKHQLRCKWPGTEEAFQIYALDKQTLNGAEGQIEYAEPFNRF